MALMVYDTYATQGAPLGQELLVPTNRVYRYAKNGNWPLAAGTVLQAAQPNTSHNNLTCAAAAAGKTEITVTLAAAFPITINDYKNGYIFINDGPGEGYMYDIVSTSGGFGEDVTVKFKIKEQLVVALTTSSQATLIKNIYENVNLPQGDPWDIIVGVAPVAVAADEYFWCQVRGPAVVLQAGGLFAGRGIMLSQRKPGAVEVLKQVIPVEKHMPRELASAATEGTPFQQKAIEQRFDVDFDLAPVDPEILTEFAGKATIPERVLGYCINPRVSAEYALVYLTIS